MTAHRLYGLRLRLRHEERGFTLIELLVVILLIAILAAIALTTFLGKKDRGEDAQAKSNARNLVTHLEACFTVERDYRNCDSSSELPVTGLDYGTGPGQVHAEGTGANSYLITALSLADNGGQHTFTIRRNSLSSAIERRCTPVGQGGCPTTGIWEVE
jgi:type IV pilus assembly protein PilA